MRVLFACAEEKASHLAVLATHRDAAVFSNIGAALTLLMNNELRRMRHDLIQYVAALVPGKEDGTLP